MTPLFRMLHSWKVQPFIWGHSDCATCVADWVHQVHGVDPIEDVRGLYDDLASCERVTGFIRRPIETMDKHLAPLGIVRGNDLKAGDVGVITNIADPKRQAVAALWTGTAWAGKSQGGCMTLSPEIVEVQAFWSVGYEA